MPIPDALEQRLESLIGLGPALLQDNDLLNEAQVQDYTCICLLGSQKGDVRLPN